jgi:hypothetical protein
MRVASNASGTANFSGMSPRSTFRAIHAPAKPEKTALIISAPAAHVALEVPTPEAVMPFPKG